MSESASPNQSGLVFPLSRGQLRERVREALVEDGAFEDVTTLATVVRTRRARAQLVARQDGVIAGAAFAIEAFTQLDTSVAARLDAPDGTGVCRGDSVIVVSGHARPLLSAERIALNFMQRLSGIASLTRRYVEAVAGTGARILDTRKTTPGWRSLEKYAVRCGGGLNHRMDLASSVLIKDNHLAALDGDIARAVALARERAPDGATIEVECDSVDQVKLALSAGAAMILLDNMEIAELKECVALVRGSALLEASGGVSLETVRAIAGTGVDYISVGALTHSPPALNLALDFD
ncbi:MAG: carboxylating nicotinate-nucleotide diphosphorylase [Gemmatimonadota bacterium]